MPHPLQTYGNYDPSLPPLIILSKAFTLELTYKQVKFSLNEVLWVGKVGVAGPTP